MEYVLNKDSQQNELVRNHDLLYFQLCKLFFHEKVEWPLQQHPLAIALTFFQPPCEPETNNELGHDISKKQNVPINK